MLRNTTVISISLQPNILSILEKIAKKTAKNKSEIIRDLLVEYNQKKSWEQIFIWGRKTKEQFNLQGEEDILKLIND